MKRKNICAEAALREVARKNHTTVEEVRKEIRLAMIVAMCNPDPARHGAPLQQRDQRHHQQ